MCSFIVDYFEEEIFIHNMPKYNNTDGYSNDKWLHLFLTLPHN